MQMDANPPIYDSLRRGDPAVEELYEVKNYRNLIFQLARRDILTRYKRSVLGVAWTLINPLGLLLVMTLAFSQFFSSVKGFPAYIFCGLIVWLFFSQTTTACMVNLVWGGSLLHRIYMPRTSFAIAAIITGLINFVITLIPLFLVVLGLGLPITWAALFLPVPIFLMAAFSLGIGLLLSTLAVYFPDVTEMYQIILTAWMYLTPIFYTENILPAQYKWLITRFNPLYHLIRMFRAIVCEARLPYWNEIWPALVLSLLVLVIGWIVFTRKSDEFSYRI
jgi:ABC-type polysaccharide/polyol phosphate export permease